MYAFLIETKDKKVYQPCSIGVNLASLRITPGPSFVHPMVGPGAPVILVISIHVTRGFTTRGFKIGHIGVDPLCPDSPFMGEEVVPSNAIVSGPSDAPIGGRFALFAKTWEQITTDSWVRATISSGLAIKFFSTPPLSFLRYPLPRDTVCRSLMDEAISHLLEIKAIQRVPDTQAGRGFYSQVFLVPKSSGGWRPILDLKRLNHFVTYRRFKMQSLRNILDGVRRGDLLCSVDLTEAYLHVPVHPSHKNVFCSCAAMAEFF